MQAAEFVTVAKSLFIWSVTMVTVVTMILVPVPIPEKIVTIVTPLRNTTKIGGVCDYELKQAKS